MLSTEKDTCFGCFRSQYQSTNYTN